MARRRFIPSLISSERATLWHLGSRSKDKASEFAREFGCGKFGTYGEVLADKEVDAVYISTPPLLHAEWVFKAAEAGKHIICEKPAFPDAATAGRAVKSCEAAGVRLIENYAFTYHPQHSLVASLIAKGEIGKPIYFYSIYSYPSPPRGDIRYAEELGAGVIHDSIGYHIAAATMHFGSKIESVAAFSKSESGVVTSFSSNMKLSDGLLAQSFVCMGGSYRSAYSILGTKGKITVEKAFSVPRENSVFITLSKERETMINVPPADQFRLLLDDFCAEVGKQDKRDREDKDFEELLLLRRWVLDSALLSASRKRLVHVSSI